MGYGQPFHQVAHVQQCINYKEGTISGHVITLLRGERLMLVS